MKEEQNTATRASGHQYALSTHKQLILCAKNWDTQNITVSALFLIIMYCHSHTILQGEKSSVKKSLVVATRVTCFMICDVLVHIRICLAVQCILKEVDATKLLDPALLSSD